jgi:hypothetical protein
MARNTSKSVALVSPVSLVSARDALTALIARSPEAAQAIALASVTRPVRNSRVSADEPISEADRAVRAAGMSAGFRQTLFRDLIARGAGTYSTQELSASTGIALYRVRADLQTIANRLADSEKFPGIGYALSFVEGKRGLEQHVRFAVVKAPVKARKASKSKAVAIVAPATQEGNEG